MKNQRKAQARWIAVLVLGVASVAGTSSPARAEREGHGGDLLDHSPKGIKEYIRKNLQADLGREISVLREKNGAVDYWETRKGQDPVAKAMLDRLHDLDQDILKSTYEVLWSCPTLDRENHAASAKVGDSFGKICFALSVIVRDGASRDGLLRLAIHEHLHHLGYKHGDPLFYSLINEFFAQRSYTPPIIVVSSPAPLKAVKKCVFRIRSGSGAVYLNGDLVGESGPARMKVGKFENGASIVLHGLLPDSPLSACLYTDEGTECDQGRGALKFYVPAGACDDY